MEKMVNSKNILDFSFFKGKKVFLTGHTGFKGSWLSVLLLKFGAQVVGYSTCSKTSLRLFDLCSLKDDITHIKGDVRDLNHLVISIKEHKPDIVIHMAAQPIVRESYVDPVGTYETNVIGTVNICEAIRQSSSVKSFLNVTTDKVYDNKEWEWGYRETDTLDGYDPYSNSKSCSELVTHAYKKSFLNQHVSVSTARAGNVIGGGDFATDRIIPDCVKAALNHEDIVVRKPFSIRPYQHVLEPLFAYLLIVEKQYKDPLYSSWYNVGPNDTDCCKTGDLVDLFIKHWGNDLKRVDKFIDGPHEANFLKLDCSKLKQTLGWKPRWDLETAVIKVVEWTKAWSEGKDVRQVMIRQIEEFLD